MPNEPNPLPHHPISPVPSPRVVRVFISSTFRDMKEERDYLVKFIFPQLRKLCEQRGVTWGEVDLRWGVTEEQKAEGKVLPICLEEIHRCRPYFIGLLGERYGWIPDHIPPDLIEREPWLREHRELSVTELEIIHGVLRDPAMHGHAYFYFREHTHLDRLPPGANRSDFECENETERQKLVGLKHKVRLARDEQVCHLRETYRDPKQLGECVLQDFTALINHLFPDEQRLDPLDRDAAEHEAFAQSRARVYIGRQEYFDRLDAHAAGDGPPLVVLGESGLGKSALLANWAFRFAASESREKMPTQTEHSRSYPSFAAKPFVFMHFIGATPYSADWAAMLRRILGEFKRRFGIQQDIPDKPDELRAAFANWLHLAAAKLGKDTPHPTSHPRGEENVSSPGSVQGKFPLPSEGEDKGKGAQRSSKIILILDALNQLEDRDGAPDMVWLPPVIPANVRLILSTLPGRALGELKKRGWPTLQVNPLDSAERRQLITEYLAQYTKTLSPAPVARIAAAPQTTNPLYLRALLEELRVFGEHERLDERISHYLDAVAVDDLYEKILARYEQDYERDRPGLVRDAMSALWAARRGLSESELLELLGSNGQPLPRAHWSPLYLAADQSLVCRSGLIGFFHDYLRQAVRGRYMPTDERQQALHLRLADYFQRLDLNRRKIDELPWQLAQGNAWQLLSDLLADAPFFEAAWESHEFEVKAYWVDIENKSALRKANVYRKAFERPGQFGSTFVDSLGAFLFETGHTSEALSLRQYQVQHYRQTNDRENLHASLGNQALILYARGDLDGAMALRKEEERLCRELGSKAGLQATLGNQANIQYARGDLDGAMALHKEQERLCRELGNKDGLCRSLFNQASLLFYKRNDPRAALPKCEEAIRILTETRIEPDSLKHAQAMLAQIRARL